MVHINQNLDNTISINDLLDISCYSITHFQRIFLSLMGENWKEYIVRNRLYKAAQRLTNTNSKISDLAVLAGFENQSSFSKAFKKLFNCNPKYFREGLFGESVYLELTNKKCRKTNNPIQLQWLPQQTLIAVKGYGSSDGHLDQGGWQAIRNLLELLIEQPAIVPLIDSWCGIVPSMMEYYKDSQGRCAAGVSLRSMGINNPLNRYRMIVPSGHYAVIKHQGILNEQSLNLAIFDGIAASTLQLDWQKPILYKINDINLLNYQQQFSTGSIYGNQLTYQHLGLNQDILKSITIDIYIPLVSN